MMFLKVISTLILFFSFLQISYADTQRVDSILNRIDSLISQKTDEEKRINYDFLFSQIHSQLIGDITGKNIDTLLEFKKELENQKSQYFTENTWIEVSTHNTLSLTFIHGQDPLPIIRNNAERIRNTRSVFLFRWTENLLGDEMMSITKEIKKINSNILLFTDQEGGEITRYVDFPTMDELQSLLESDFVTYRLQSMSWESRKVLFSVFDTYKLYYYPSLESIWNAYNSISDEDSKKYFLEISAYIRLASIRSVWLNTYGLILDLDYGNPVISWYARSFSKDLWEYQKLVDAFILASEVTSVSVYAKHFPWHWKWAVDSHKAVLDISSFPEYTQANMNLFEYFLWRVSSVKKWIMVGHMYVWDDFLEAFNRILDTADYILTDDLSMQWYQLATGNDKNNSFFTTDTIINRKNLIKLWNTQSDDIK